MIIILQFGQHIFHHAFCFGAQFIAHLVWSAAANTPGQAFAGLRFLTIDREPLERLRQWVNAGPEAE